MHCEARPCGDLPRPSTGCRALRIGRRVGRGDHPLRARARLRSSCASYASGVCHSDLSVVRGTFPFMFPTVLGHEGSGVIESVGSAVTRVAPGDHVVLTWMPPCRQCFYLPRGTDRPVRRRARGGDREQLRHGRRCAPRPRARGGGIRHSHSRARRVGREDPRRCGSGARGARSGARSRPGSGRCSALRG